MTLDAGQLYLDHAPAVRRMLGKLLAPDEVDDVLADVFERVVRSVATYEDRGYSVRAWLYAIARARVIDLKRSQRRRGIPVSLNERTVAIAGPEEATERALIQLWTRAQIRAHLAGRQQRIIWLRFVEDLTRDEVAQRLGITVGAVGAVQFRATAKLRSALVVDGGHCDE